MKNLLLIATFMSAASALFAGPKCDAAYEELDKIQAKTTAALNIESTNDEVKEQQGLLKDALMALVGKHGKRLKSTDIICLQKMKLIREAIKIINDAEEITEKPEEPKAPEAPPEAPEAPPEAPPAPVKALCDSLKKELLAGLETMELNLINQGLQKPMVEKIDRHIRALTGKTRASMITQKNRYLALQTAALKDVIAAASALRLAAEEMNRDENEACQKAFENLTSAIAIMKNSSKEAAGTGANIVNIIDAK